MKHHLSERHARTLLRVEDVALRQKLLETIVERGLNVAQAEELVAEALQPKKTRGRQKRTFIAKDIRLFINTIDHAVDAMKTAGIPAQTEKKETADYIECTVRIPKSTRVQV